MSLIGLLTFGIILELLVPFCASAAPGMGAGSRELSAVTVSSGWSRAGLSMGTNLFHTAERASADWMRPEARRFQVFQVGTGSPFRGLHGVRLTPDNLAVRVPTRGPLPAANFLQQAWLKVSQMRPDVTVQSVPGHGGMRVMLAVDTLSLFRL